jgi:NAD(P)-dependent dehydrogenase (short-subunit alcohol dehydrogenase family)
MALLRDGLLNDRAVALGGGAPQAVEAGLVGRGARVEILPEPEVDEDRVGEWSRSHGPFEALVYDTGSAFGSGGSEGLLVTLRRTWSAVREVALGSLIPGDGPGKIVLLAPGPRVAAGDALRAALENLARTLSVEWARYRLTAVALAPAAGSSPEDVAELVCFLCSEAGDYFSGCQLEMRG